MAEFHSVVEVNAAPADGQVAVYDAAADAWKPATVATTGIVVPQTHIAAASAPAAATAVTVATANAATQTGSYVQADVQSIAALANALKTALNANIADVAALVTEVGALTTKVNTLLTELATAGVLA